ncbi:MBL fold metallo-hydrolase [Verrucomicrobiales bacterium]|jgi:glyoxylase-like metal-dependent hydrolase (beta-lactamase superfamily II)|nr:MBL fold metallo-hydrolase [Verrucomicrobiales bacterium]
MIHTIDLNFQGHPGTIAAFLIETAVGPVLVESGPATTLESLEIGVQQAGFVLTDIQHVFLTHIHFDHAGAAWRFAEHGATIHVHPFGQSHLADPEVLWKSAKRVFGDATEQLWGEMRCISPAQIHACDHEEEIQVGQTLFTAWHTPGHAKHHIAWQCGEDALFAGDAAGVSLSGGPVQPPCPPPDINLEAWMDSIDRLQACSAETLYLTHFGAVSEKESHLAALRECLDDWHHWVAERFDESAPADLVAPFAEHVADQLRQAGLSSKALANYEVANPTQMSVYGLARYLNQRRTA